MKQLLAIIIAVCLTTTALTQSNSSPKIQHTMKLNAGIVTEKLAETKAFYTQTLNFGVTFENEFYLLMHTPNKAAEISFLLPNHPSQQALFHKPFQSQGMYLTIEVEDVDQVYNELKNKGVDIKIDLRDEPWGDRHFAIQDPNGIGIDIVTYSPQEEVKGESFEANKVTWFSIPSDDIHRAIKFYKDAFNWQIEPKTQEVDEDFSFYVALNSKSDANYISLEKGMINGCIVKREIGLSTPAILVEVDNLDRAIERVEKAGGKLVTTRKVMNSLKGEFVLIKDTEGNFVELFQNIAPK